MSDYIKREDALNASKVVYIEFLETDEEGYIEGDADYIPVVFKKDIEKLPAADVVERANANEAEFWKDQYICASEDQEQKHGKWLDVTTLDNEFICWVCSECRHGADFVYEPYNFCPQCGARMDVDS